MDDETPVERLKRLPNDLVRVSAETARLRSAAAIRSIERNNDGSVIKPVRSEHRADRSSKPTRRFDDKE